MPFIGPPPGYVLGFKTDSQTDRLYGLLVAAWAHPSKPRVPLEIIFKHVGPTTNHRRMMCDIRDALKRPSIIEKYGRWTVPPARVGKKHKSWYWLERSN